MKKYFVCSDIHSFYDEWMAALDKEGFDITNKDHCIIVCGDLLDRGEKPIECLEFANKMYDEGRAVLVKGNHESLLEAVFRKGYFERHDDHNGTIDTCIALANKDVGDCCDSMKVKVVVQAAQQNKEVKKYLDSVVNYAEIGDNIFVHGWIPFSVDEYNIFYDPVATSYDPNWREADYEAWEDARWVNGMNQWLKGVKEPGKTIWCGHWHSSWGHANIHNDGVEYLHRYETMHQLEDGTWWPYVNNTPFIDEGIIALDACTARSGFVNCVVFEGED